MDQFTEETGYCAPSWEAMVREMRRDTTPYDPWKAADRGLAPPESSPSQQTVTGVQRL